MFTYLDINFRTGNLLPLNFFMFLAVNLLLSKVLLAWLSVL